MTVALTLFGAPTIVYGGKSVALALERRTQLLVYLALKRTWVGRAELAALLWPDQDSKLAFTNLRKALFRLQRFPWANQIEAQGSSLRFDAATDVQAFERALREHRTSEALPLFSGPLLTGFDDDSNEAWSGWLGFERDRLQSAWRGAAQEQLDGSIEAVEAIELAARLLDVDPLDEAALQAYMRWLARAGQVARARQAYREFVTRLADELGLEPGAELKALHDAMSAGSTPAAIAVPSKAVPLDDGFVGRTVELRRIAALLSQDDCRLLCLTGPGGVGKTRLAQRVLRELAHSFADGATFIPLDDLDSSTELGGRLARELGVSLKGRGEPLQQVVEALQPRQTLLVLDNFEQLIDGAPQLELLLAACPQVKIVVTSRLRLALSSEWLMPLEGLPFPEKEDQDNIESFDAARLFVRAARRVQPELVPAAEAAAIVDICRQVEGLPLALELAAAWTRVLSCEAIANELRHGLELLHATDGTQPSRHASIEVVFEQSWRLLTDIERDVLSRLSVFHGSFSPVAARAVASAPLPVLGALADKSLLHKEKGRLHLHPLVQQLAAARLANGASATETEAAHAAYFHRLLAQLRSTAESGKREALQQIDDDFENCRRAWQWSIAHGQADVLNQSSRTLLDYCDYRGRFEAGLALLGQAIDSPLAQANLDFQALMLSRASHLEYRLDRYAEAEAHAQRVVTMTRRSRDRTARLQALNVLGTCAVRMGRLAEAKRYFNQRLELASPDGHAHAAAVTLDHLALIEKQLGHYTEALRLSLQSLAEHRRLGDSAGEALCLNNLGSLQLVMREDMAAAEHLREGLSICERDGLLSTQAFILTNLTEATMRAGDLPSAEAYGSRAIEVAGATGNRAVAAWAKIKVARLAVRRDNADTARPILADGLGTVLAIGLPSLKFDGIECFAEILAAQGEVSCARAVLDFAAGHRIATAATREELRAHGSGLLAESTDVPTWPGLELDELLQRIVVESSLAYAPLIATLRGTR